MTWTSLAHELRTRCRWSGGKLNHYQDPCEECDRCRAADEIERLQARVKELEGALRTGGLHSRQFIYPELRGTFSSIYGNRWCPLNHCSTLWCNRHTIASHSAIGT